MVQHGTNASDDSRIPDPRIRDPEALGRLVRRVRRDQGLTLESLYAVSGLTTRFLSEFERGKSNASVGRVMDALEALGLTMLVMPREEAERLLSRRRRPRRDKTHRDEARRNDSPGDD